MRKQMIENAAYEVATQVRAVEESIDAALAEIAELQARMIARNASPRAGFVTEPRRASSSSAAATRAGRGPRRRSRTAMRRWPMPSKRPGPAHRRVGRR